MVMSEEPSDTMREFDGRGEEGSKGECEKREKVGARWPVLIRRKHGPACACLLPLVYTGTSDQCAPAVS